MYSLSSIYFVAIASDRSASYEVIVRMEQSHTVHKDDHHQNGEL